MKRLERSRDSSVIGGVCGGLGEYFEIDPVIWRIAFILTTFLHGAGLVAYIICWIAIPRRKEGVAAPTTSEAAVTAGTASHRWLRYLPGAALIFFGGALLLDRLTWWFRFHDIWPIALVIAGILLVAMSMHNHNNNRGEAHERGQS